ncbi:MAG: molybdenum cofactor biosynthesis protein MoaE [Firmicutes bacterium]|nr:molybdenum cofactor biosynthesis protein MoaE [Alicyclobacillaceae bacterium]MCL6498025.1 molybdenum cofactor biosynthesis protein MoaE [Bacillota bacterium]
MAEDAYQIVDGPIDVAAALARLSDPSCGGLALFLGTVRNEFEGRPSQGLVYEAYPAMAEAAMAAIGRALKAAYPIRHVVMVHRVGRLGLEEVSVLVGVAAPHREAAFAACREGIDRLKQEVPIWKKEIWQDGSEAWHHDPEAGMQT